MQPIPPTVRVLSRPCPGGEVSGARFARALPFAEVVVEWHVSGCSVTLANDRNEGAIEYRERYDSVGLPGNFLSAKLGSFSIGPVGSTT